MNPEPNVVIADLDLIKETLLKQGDVFSGRPHNYIQNEMFRGGTYGILVNDGSVWKQQRRFSLHVLRDFGFGRQVMEAKVMKEVQKLVAKLESYSKIPGGANIANDLRITVANVISSIMMGRTVDSEVESLLALMDSFQGQQNARMLFFMFLLGSLPSLRHIPLFGHFGYDSLAEIRDGFVGYCQDRIKDHKESFNPLEEPGDYIAAFLKEIHRRKDAGEDMESFSEWQLCMALFDIWLAGMETTRLTLNWSILFMILHPEIQERCYQEIHEVMKDRDEDTEIKMADRNSCPFVAATVAEIQRLANILPLNVQHKVTQNVIVNGHHIRAGTTVLPQICTVLWSDKLFPNPEKFHPERFLESDGRTLKKESMDNVVAFSMGKRACLGESLARMELFLAFSTLIQHFQFSVPLGEKPPPMTPKNPMRRIPVDYNVEIKIR